MNFRSACTPFFQIAFLLLAMMLAPANAGAQKPATPFPEFENEFFNDYTGFSSAGQKLEVTRNLRLGSQSSQIHTMIIAIKKMADYPGMPQEALAFATNLAQSRKVGSQKTHQGILVLFSIEDRKYAVARSTNLPQSLSDSIRDSLSTRMRNKFKEGDYGQGFVYAAEDVASSLPKAAAPHANAPQATATHVGAPALAPAPAPATGERARQPSPPAEDPKSALAEKASGLGLGTILLFVVGAVAVCSLLSRLFSGGGGGGYGFGGGGGPGWGGLLGGLLGGGLLGYWLGNSSSHSNDNITGGNQNDQHSGSGDSGSSDSGGFDSFGGGDYGGDSGGSDGGGSGSEGDW